MLRLENARIKNYRSIADSGIIDFEKDITSLIGENESGKTNLLHALESLNLGENYHQDDLCLYNREEWQGKDDSEIEIVTAAFDCDGGDEFNFINKDLQQIQVTKYFDSHYTVNLLFDEKEVDVNVGHDLLRIHHVIPEINDVLEKMEEVDRFENEAGGRINLDEYRGLKGELTAKLEGPYEARELTDIIQDLISCLNQMRKEANHNSAQQAVTQARNEIQTLKKDIESEGPIDEDLPDSDDLPEIFKKGYNILQEIPRFILHEGVEGIDDQIDINQFKREENRTFSNLLQLSGLDVDKIPENGRDGRFRKTKPASAEISGIINESWSQETIELELDIDGDVLSVYLSDDQAAEGAFTSPSERSKGFQYFLAFYINFTAESKGELQDTVLLLDDPGVYLHPSGKKDLLATLEQLSDTNQVIYNTHSPFLINQDRLNRIRIVDRNPSTNGTTVQSEFHQNDSDALAPVRTALGAGIADSLFGSHSNILVEGPSDKIYIDALSNYFRRRNRADEALDPDEVSVINVGGADKMPYFARLIDAEGYDYTILLDNDNKGRNRKEELVSEHDISSENVFLISDFVPGVDGFDSEIEDLFDHNFFYDMVIEAYSDIFEEDDLASRIEDVPEKSIASSYERIFGEELSTSFDKVMVAKHISTVVRRDDCSDDTVGEETIVNYRDLLTNLTETL